MTLTLRQLRCFATVAEEGHITRAAERLGMQQPPLSQLMKAIERELGAQLLLRQARGVALTEAGRTLLGHAHTLLAHYDRALEATQAAARGEQGRIVVGVMPTAPFHPFVPSSIRAFRAAVPRVSLTLDECLRAEAIERLKDGRMDVAFMRAPLSEPELVIYPLLEEPMVVALPREHPLGRSGRRGAEALSIKDLAEEPFIVYARQLGPAIYETTVAACLRAGFSPRLGQEAPRVISALSLVAVGLGISLVPACMQRMALEGIVYRPLKGAVRPKVVLNLAARRGDPSPVVRRFLRLVRQAAREQPAA